MPVLTDLTVRQPDSPSPLQTVGALMQLRGQQGEIALRNAQLAQANANTADIQAQAQDRQRKNTAMEKLTGLLADPAVHGSLRTGDLTPLSRAGIPLDVAAPVVKNLQEAYQKAGELDKQKAEYHAAGRDLVKQAIEGIDPNNDALAANQLDGAMREIFKDHPDLAQGYQPIPPGADFRSKVSDVAAGNLVGRAILLDKVGLDKKNAEVRNENAQADMNAAHGEQFKADTAKLAADTANVRANLPKLQADAKVAQLESEFAAAHGGMKPAEAETARHNRVDESVAAGELGLKTKTFNMTYGPNAINQGLIGVQPHLIVPATSAYTKAGEEFATAVHAQDAMNTLLDLAQKGNKAAGSNLPLVGVETINALNGIKRINSAEISQYGTAGDLLDGLKGKIGKVALGKPIPQDVLDDIRELHTQLGAQAKDLYARKVQVVNGAYGSKFQPVEFSGSATGSGAAAPASPAVGTLSQGYRFRGGNPAEPSSWEKVQP